MVRLFSLGGFTALMAASELSDAVRGVVLLNSAGQFGNQAQTAEERGEESIPKKYLLNPLKEALQRVILGFLFWQAKQPSRVESVLKSVSFSSAQTRRRSSPAIFFVLALVMLTGEVLAACRCT